MWAAFKPHGGHVHAQLKEGTLSLFCGPWSHLLVMAHACEACSPSKHPRRLTSGDPRLHCWGSPHDQALLSDELVSCNLKLVVAGLFSRLDVTRKAPITAKTPQGMKENANQYSMASTALFVILHRTHYAQTEGRAGCSTYWLTCMGTFQPSSN
jgi:hypothetical protein